jgi:hypothetical protein
VLNAEQAPTPSTRRTRHDDGVRRFRVHGVPDSDDAGHRRRHVHVCAIASAKSADAGALSGAVALAFNDFNNRNAGGPAVSAAISAAKANGMVGEAPSVLPADVSFPNDPTGKPTRVRVAVYRNAERLNQIPTIFGRIFGVDAVNISARRNGRGVTGQCDDLRQAIHDSGPMAGSVRTVQSADQRFPDVRQPQQSAPGQPT